MANELNSSTYNRTIVRNTGKPKSPPQKQSAKNEQYAIARKRVEKLRERAELAEALGIPIHELEDF